MLATAGRRRRLTLAPKPPLQPMASSPPSGVSSSGSRFSVLGSDSSGSEDDGDSIPVKVALQALNEELPEEGWTPVVRRRKKTEKEVVGDFWREISFPTPLSRYWEKSRRSPSPVGMTPLFCRSVDVYTASGGGKELDGSPADGSPPPVGLVCRGAASSPSGLRIARSPRMGPWRGPLPKRRITPPLILGQFLEKVIGNAAATPAAGVPSGEPVQPGAVIAGGSPAAVITGGSSGVVIADGTSGAMITDSSQSKHATVLVEQFASRAANQASMLPWAHLRCKFRQLWVQSCPSEAARVFPAAASSITPTPSTLVSASLKIAADRSPSTSTPLPVVPASSTTAGSRRSFADVVGMSGPPQRPPPPGVFAMGHVRPPLRRPPPVTQGAGGAGPSAGVAGALPSFGSIGGAPL
jgi:hypothetical protein